MALSVEEIVSARPLCRSVEIAQRQEMDMWEFADAVFEDVLDRVPDPDGVRTPSHVHGVNNGIAPAVAEIYKAHREAGTDKNEASLLNMVRTVRAWPAEQRRPHLASFQVHYELRGDKFKNRVELIEKHAARSKSGRWSFRDFRRWRSEQKPPAFKSFTELFEQRVRGAAFQAGKPWNQIAEGDRTALASICRDIANEIEAGTFGV